MAFPAKRAPTEHYLPELRSWLQLLIEIAVTLYLYTDTVN